MQTRNTIGLLLITVVVALVSAWIYTLVGVGAQFESLLPAPGAATVADPSRRATPAVEASQAPTVAAPPVDAGAEGVGASEAMPTGGGIAEDEAVVEPQTGPIDAASFAELLDSGLLDETGDAAELREALREAAATKDDELE